VIPRSSFIVICLFPHLLQRVETAALSSEESDGGDNPHRNDNRDSN
jgi:hypothetical protein